MKALYDKLEHFWSKVLLKPDWSPFVWIAHYLGSECPICAFWRALVLGAGITLIIFDHLMLGGVMVVGALLLALMEGLYGED